MCDERKQGQPCTPREIKVVVTIEGCTCVKQTQTRKVEECQGSAANEGGAAPA